MPTENYPEIILLDSILKKHDIKIIESANSFLDDQKYFPSVNFIIGKDSFLLFVNDEYEDLKLHEPRLSLCVVLRTLEEYKDAKDLLEWAKQNGLNASNSVVRNYHMSLAVIYQKIEKLLGKIESQINDFDFTLNAGAAKALRNAKK